MKKYKLIELIDTALNDNDDITIYTVMLLYDATAYFLKDKEKNAHAAIRKMQKRLAMILIAEDAIKETSRWDFSEKIGEHIIEEKLYDKISESAVAALKKVYDEI